MLNFLIHKISTFENYKRNTEKDKTKNKMGKRRHKKDRGKKVDRRGRRRHLEQQKAEEDKRKTTGQNRTQITKQKTDKGVKQMGIWGLSKRGRRQKK